MADALSVAFVAVVGGLLLYLVQLGIWALYIKTPCQATALMSGIGRFGCLAVGLVVLVNALRFFVGRRPSAGEFIAMPVVVAELFLVVLLALATIRRLKAAERR